MRPRALDVPQLDAEQHHVDLADAVGIVCRLRRHEMGVAALALHPQPLALHRGQMRAARNEGDVGACLRQGRAEPASDAARADHRNPHQFLPDHVRPSSALDVSGSM
jgi:hypothetical protein